MFWVIVVKKGKEKEGRSQISESNGTHQGCDDPTHSDDIFIAQLTAGRYHPGSSVASMHNIRRIVQC